MIEQIYQIMDAAFDHALIEGPSKIEPDRADYSIKSRS